MARITGTNLFSRLLKGAWYPLRYTVATLPDESVSLGKVVYVSDGDAGDECLAYCDGTQWLIIAIGAAVNAGSGSGSGP